MKIKRNPLSKSKAEANLDLEAQVEAAKKEKAKFQNSSPTLKQRGDLEEMVPGQFLQVSIHDIEFHPENQSVYGSEIHPALADSMFVFGLLQNIIVCQGSDKSYRCLSGHSRLTVLLNQDFQANYKRKHGQELLNVTVKYLGFIDRVDQELFMLEFNLYRQKSWLQRVLEAIKEEKIRSQEAGSRSKKGKASDGNEPWVGRVDAFVADKYLGVKKDTFRMSKAIVLHLLEEVKGHHPSLFSHKIIVAINKGDKKVKPVYVSIFEKGKKSIDNETRITKGITQEDYSKFLPRYEKMGFNIDKLKTKEDMKCAYKFHNSSALKVKAAFLNVSQES
jgi:hypothetical protein